MTMNPKTVKAIEQVYRDFFCLKGTQYVLVEEHQSKDDVEPGYVDLLIEPAQTNKYNVYYAGTKGWTLFCIVEGDRAFYDERFVRKADTDVVGPWLRGDLLYILEQYDCIYVTDKEEVYQEVWELAALRRMLSELGLYDAAEYKEAKNKCPCCGEDLSNQSCHSCGSSNFI